MASPDSTSRPIPFAPAGNFSNPFGGSFPASSPLAQEILARDLAECPDEDIAADASVVEAGECESDEDIPGPTLYRRPSGIAFGTSRPALSLGPAGPDESPLLSRVERTRSREAERSLLRDNHIIPPKRHDRQHHGAVGSLYRRLFSTGARWKESDEESNTTETTALLRGRPRAPTPHEHEHLNEQWEAAVAAGQIRTTWQREAKTIATYSRSLIVTFLLQYSLNATSIFAVGRLGTRELGAVTLASMSSTVTVLAPTQGFCTSLDTLCGQAYGAGHKQLVGLHLQRMIYFLMLWLGPISLIWLNGEWILAHWIEAESAALAGTYLRTLLFGVPAYMCFEAGKRFLQAQGIFHATTYVLFVAAPTNVFLNWFLVWHLGMGFQGAPLAVVLTQNMLPWLLLLYVWKVDGSQAWGGFHRAALRNWGPMIRLGFPGMIMVVAEWFAFEILTLASGRIGVATLAAQSVVMTVTAITFQIPFPLSIAGSTRIANFIGASLVDAAKTTAKVVSLVIVQLTLDPALTT